MASLLGLARLCTCHPSSFGGRRIRYKRQLFFLPENPACDQSPPIFLELDERTPGAEHYSPLVSSSETDTDAITEGEIEIVTDDMIDKALGLDSPKVVIDAAKDSIEAPKDTGADDTIVYVTKDTSIASDHSKPSHDASDSSLLSPMPKKREGNDGGCFVVGSASNPIAEAARCANCRNLYRVVGKKKSM